MNYEEIFAKLEEKGQEHILKYYDELGEEEKKALLEAAQNLDLSVLDLIKNDKEESGRGEFSPLSAITVDEIQKREKDYVEAGLQAIRNCKVGAVLLAGGQGTRLGFDKPKGMFNIGVNKELYIFEQLIRNMLDVVEAAGEYVPLFIMTSEKNHDDTVSFFEEHKYFGYKADMVFFFKQEMAPSVGYNGKILMEGKGRLSSSPNGNGGWFMSMANAGLIEQLDKMNIEWLNVFAVDNVLQKIADPKFVGAAILSGCESASKVVKKASPDERVGVLCLEDGKPSIVEYYEMSKKMSEMRDKDGNLLYNYGVILNYLFRIDALKRILSQKLPVHVVEKKIPHIDDEGNYISPSEPNGYKFEQLVLDMIHMMDDCLPYEVIRENEFAPVKNAKGVDSVDTARELLKKNGIEI